MTTTDEHPALTFTGDYGTVTVATNLTEPDATALYLNGGTLAGIDVAPATFTRVIAITPAGIEPAYLTRYLIGLARAAKLKATLPADAKAVPRNQVKPVEKVWAQLQPLMTLLGVSLTKPKHPAAKGRHRWTKAIATVPFTTTYAGTRATVYWQKRNELRIEAGAQLLAEPPLNADGSLGFSARFATQLRQEHAEAIGPDHKLREDVVLKSVNEVGLFLYFAGTNSWLQLRDPEGQTIDALTRVPE